MTKSLSSIVLGLACVALLGGCASKEKQLEGKWKMKPIDLGPAAASNPFASMFKSGSLEVKPDHKFTLTVGDVMEGDWALTDTATTFTFKTIAGTEISKMPSQFGVNALAKPINATMSEDGKTLSLAGVGGKQDLTFEKDNS